MVAICAGFCVAAVKPEPDFGGSVSVLARADLAAGLAYAHRRQVAKGQALALVHCDIAAQRHGVL